MSIDSIVRAVVTERRGMDISNPGAYRGARNARPAKDGALSGDKTTETPAGGPPEADDDTQSPTVEIGSSLAFHSGHYHCRSTFQLTGREATSQTREWCQLFQGCMPETGLVVRRCISFCPPSCWIPASFSPAYLPT